MNKKCQVFTPPDYVEKLLDSVGYKSDLMGKRILENSCGDGNILIAVVQRYINNCVSRGLSRTKIKNGLAKDVVGVEIDPEQYELCIENLNKVIEKNDIPQVKWQIYNEDYLRRTDDTKYDYIVGNPPYITYSEMESADQEYLKKKFTSCEKGKFDYCYAFIEKSISSLSKKGKMAYLIPSSVFKTVSGETVRNAMLPIVYEIIEYTHGKVFSEALVKSAIVVMDKQAEGNIIYYSDETTFVKRDILRDSLGTKWAFSEIEQGTRRFGDYFKVSHVVATLLNDAFVLRDGSYKRIATGYKCDKYIIENEIVRDTDTPKTKQYGKKEKIIFPYYYENNKVRKYSPEEFEKQFSGAYAYLNSFRSQLDERKKDKNAQWFEYGRSQALSRLNTKKLLISTVISDKLEIHKISKQSVPYAGMFIVTKKSNKSISLDEAKKILEDQSFLNYARNIGIHVNGESVRITSKDIEEYLF